MTTFDDGLWARLVAEHDADHVTLTVPPHHTTRRPAIISAGAVALAAAITAVVLALSATADTPPAYALTPH
jgi:hypothetical protein